MSGLEDIEEHDILSKMYKAIHYVVKFTLSSSYFINAAFLFVIF